MCDPPRVPCDFLSGSSLTPAVSGRRPDEAFHVHPKPQTGGGHEHGVVRLSLSLHSDSLSLPFHLLNDFFRLAYHVLNNLRRRVDVVHQTARLARIEGNVLHVTDKAG